MSEIQFGFYRYNSSTNTFSLDKTVNDSNINDPANNNVIKFILKPKVYTATWVREYITQESAIYNDLSNASFNGFLQIDPDNLNKIIINYHIYALQSGGDIGRFKNTYPDSVHFVDFSLSKNRFALPMATFNIGSSSITLYTGYDGDNKSYNNHNNLGTALGDYGFQYFTMWRKNSSDDYGYAKMYAFNNYKCGTFVYMIDKAFTKICLAMQSTYTISPIGSLNYKYQAFMTDSPYNDNGRAQYIDFPDCNWISTTGLDNDYDGKVEIFTVKGVGDNTTTQYAITGAGLFNKSRIALPVYDSNFPSPQITITPNICTLVSSTSSDPFNLGASPDKFGAFFCAQLESDEKLLTGGNVSIRQSSRRYSSSPTYPPKSSGSYLPYLPIISKQQYSIEGKPVKGSKLASNNPGILYCCVTSSPTPEFLCYIDRDFQYEIGSVLSISAPPEISASKPFSIQGAESFCGTNIQNIFQSAYNESYLNITRGARQGNLTNECPYLLDNSYTITTPNQGTLLENTLSCEFNDLFSELLSKYRVTCCNLDLVSPATQNADKTAMYGNKLNSFSGIDISGLTTTDFNDLQTVSIYRPAGGGTPIIEACASLQTVTPLVANKIAFPNSGSTPPDQESGLFTSVFNPSNIKWEAKNSVPDSNQITVVDPQGKDLWGFGRYYKLSNNSGANFVNHGLPWILSSVASTTKTKEKEKEKEKTKEVEVV